MRVRLHWTTPVGPIEDVRDFHLTREGDIWKTVWPKVTGGQRAGAGDSGYLPALGSGNAAAPRRSGDLKNVDAPHVRIISMNAVDSAAGAVVMGEVVNEDTIPAFVNVNATLVDGSGQRDRRREQLRQDCARALAEAGYALPHRLSEH